MRPPDFRPRRRPSAAAWRCVLDGHVQQEVVRHGLALWIAEISGRATTAPRFILSADDQKL
jgi:predicted NAD/FAD-binding protein